MTTRGFKEEEFKKVAGFILAVLKNPEDEALKADIKKQVIELTDRFDTIA